MWSHTGFHCGGSGGGCSGGSDFEPGVGQAQIGGKSLELLQSRALLFLSFVYTFCCLLF